MTLPRIPLLRDEAAERSAMRAARTAEILRLLNEGLSQEETARRVGVSRSAVRYAQNPERIKERFRKWREDNPERQRQSDKKWRSNHPDVVRRRAKLWSAANPGRVRATRLKITYGVTVEQYNAMLVAQGGVCAICRESEREKNGVLSVDHCHVTGRFRGLLCHKCNQAIGCFRDRAENCIAAAEYLRRP